MVPLGLLRPLCFALPEVTERLSNGEPTWFVKNRAFVMFADHHHDDRLACWLAAAPGAQPALIAEDPVRFFVPPYVGGRGWIGAWLDRGPDWRQLAELVAEAYRAVAPARLVALLDAD